MPLAAPVGMLQYVPAQHSAVPVQVPPNETHVMGGMHPAVWSQTPLQHSDEAAQVELFVLHAEQKPLRQRPEQHSPLPRQCVPLEAHVGPASEDTPPSEEATPPSDEGPIGPLPARQIVLFSSPSERHDRPSQQTPDPVAPGVHLAPAAMQWGARQTYLPPPSAPPSYTQGLRLQHWSRNWHSAPSAMQQSGSVPCQPVLQSGVLPPKQRESPELSCWQTAFWPSQQACSQLAPCAPQQFPTGWHDCLLEQRPNGDPVDGLSQVTPLVTLPQHSSSVRQISPRSRQPVPRIQLARPVPRSRQRRLQQLVGPSQGSPPTTHSLAPGTVTEAEQRPGPVPLWGRRQLPLQQSEAW